MSDLAIETQSLHKHYDTFHAVAGFDLRLRKHVHTVKAVDGLELRVPRGSIYGFLGRNGAGKTTTIRMLAGLVHPTGGEMRVLDLSPRTERVAMLSRTGFMIDRMPLPSMTGLELVRFNRGFFPRWNDALAGKYADALEITMRRKFR